MLRCKAKILRKIPSIKPKNKGTKKVRAPKTRLFLRVLISSRASNSSPTRNIRYNNPAVLKSFMLSTNSTKFSACGPIMIPETINPTIPGIRNFLNRIGATRIIEISNVKTITGSLNGKSGKRERNMLVVFEGSANLNQLNDKSSLNSKIINLQAKN